MLCEAAEVCGIFLLALGFLVSFSVESFCLASFNCIQVYVCTAYINPIVFLKLFTSYWNTEFQIHKCFYFNISFLTALVQLQLYSIQNYLFPQAPLFIFSDLKKNCYLSSVSTCLWDCEIAHNLRPYSVQSPEIKSDPNQNYFIALQTA